MYSGKHFSYGRGCFHSSLMGIIFSSYPSFGVPSRFPGRNSLRSPRGDGVEKSKPSSATLQFLVSFHLLCAPMQGQPLRGLLLLLGPGVPLLFLSLDFRGECSLTNHFRPAPTPVAHLIRRSLTFRGSVFALIHFYFQAQTFPSPLLPLHAIFPAGRLPAFRFVGGYFSLPSSAAGKELIEWFYLTVGEYRFANDSGFSFGLPVCQCVPLMLF